MSAGVPLLLALGAGGLSTVNPCGFAMLPAFVAFFLGEPERARSVGHPVVRALLVGGLVTAGFLAVFGVIGIVVSVGSRSVARYIPWMALAVGSVLVLVGAATLAGRSLSFGLHPVKQVRGRNNRSMVLYGVAYGVASLGCTLPVFLVVVGVALSAGGVAASLAVFVSYALGMGAVLTGVSVATALGRGAFVRLLRRALPYSERIGGFGLLVAGGYLVYREVAFLRFSGWL